MQPSPAGPGHPVLDALRAPLARARPGLLLDFDGTLSELAPTPDEARLHPACGEAVARLLALDVPVGIVSGRTCDDLRGRAPLAGAWLSGIHGAELDAPGPARLAAKATPGVRAALTAFLEGARALEPWGVRLEDKRLAAAAHVRGVSPERQREATARLIGLAQEAAARSSEVAWIEGKAVIELRARQASKANATRMLLRRWPAGTFLIAVGDDTTDEDMFLEALRAGGAAVKVGQGPTAAPHRVADPTEVARLLGALASALSSPSAGDDGRAGR